MLAALTQGRLAVWAGHLTMEPALRGWVLAEERVSQINNITIHFLELNVFGEGAA